MAQCQERDHHHHHHQSNSNSNPDPNSNPNPNHPDAIINPHNTKIIFDDDDPNLFLEQYYNHQPVDAPFETYRFPLLLYWTRRTPPRGESEFLILHYYPEPNIIYEFNDTPRYFAGMDDAIIEQELLWRMEQVVYHDDVDIFWRERVILEAMYFQLIYGMTEPPMDFKDRTGEQSKLETSMGWRIDRRDDSNPYCQWKGITCNANGKVNSITLDACGLAGTLPQTLSYLTDLEAIDLRGNRLHGTIPTSWGSFRKLTSLNLAINELTGRLPTELAQVRTIQQVWLSNNDITGSIPPTVIDKWNKIRLLDLSNNRVEGTIPTELGTSCPYLLNLFLENNRLTGGLPEMTAGLQNLQVIDVGSNRLEGTIPTGWMLLPKLRDFNIAGNQFSGSIPTHVMLLTNLEVLVLVRTGYYLSLLKAQICNKASPLNSLSSIL